MGSKLDVRKGVPTFHISQKSIAYGPIMLAKTIRVKITIYVSFRLAVLYLRFAVLPS